MAGEFRENLASLSRLFAASANRRFKFYKRSKLVVGMHNETLCVAMRVRLQSRLFARWNQSLSTPTPTVLLRCSAMIFQYFTAAPYSTRRASQPLPHFLERADARDIRGSRDGLAAVCESHKFVPVRS